jgi:alkyl sulfatase BDS1-like metallo-beta-lactamase superfamily hydrolase
MKTKVCTKCNKRQKIDDFVRDCTKKDGHHTHCKECKKIYKIEHKEELKEYQNMYNKKYYVANIEKIREYKKTAISIYNMIRSNAKRRNIDLNFTYKNFSEWYNLQIQECHYCKKSLAQTKKDKTTTGHNFQRLTIDRKDNNKGYNINNITLSCGYCNYVKGHIFTEQEMLKIGKFLGENIYKNDI